MATPIQVTLNTSNVGVTQTQSNVSITLDDGSVVNATISASNVTVTAPETVVEVQTVADTLVGGTGVNITGSIVSIGQPVGTTDSVTFANVTTGNLSATNITGNITGNVIGNITGNITGTANNALFLNGIAAANYLLVNGSGLGLTAINGGNVQGTVANAAYADNANNSQFFAGLPPEQYLRVNSTGNGLTAINGANVTGTVANAATANNALFLGGVAAANYLQVNGNGSQLTNINGANVTGTVGNANLSQYSRFSRITSFTAGTQRFLFTGASNPGESFDVLRFDAGDNGMRYDIDNDIVQIGNISTANGIILNASTGNITANNLSIANRITAVGNISAANISITGNLTGNVTGNVFGTLYGQASGALEAATALGVTYTGISNSSLRHHLAMAQGTLTGGVTPVAGNSAVRLQDTLYFIPTNTTFAVRSGSDLISVRPGDFEFEAGGGMEVGYNRVGNLFCKPGSTIGGGYPDANGNIRLQPGWANSVCTQRSVIVEGNLSVITSTSQGASGTGGNITANIITANTSVATTGNITTVNATNINATTRVTTPRLNNGTSSIFITENGNISFVQNNGQQVLITSQGMIIEPGTLTVRGGGGNVILRPTGAVEAREISVTSNISDGVLNSITADQTTLRSYVKTVINSIGGTTEFYGPIAFSNNTLSGNLSGTLQGDLTIDCGTF